MQNPGTTPKARVTYVAEYPDPIGRPVTSANYGTNAGTALVRSTTAPARSDTILVSSVSYDATGSIALATDPAGMVTALTYEAAGRTTELTENDGGASGGGSLCTASDDTDRVTQFTYTADGQLSTLVAVNSRTTNQTTTYSYGTTLSDSDVATSNLLRFVNHPDSAGGSDRVAYTYNRQGQRISITDQRGCVHSCDYDGLGRMTHDR